MAKIHYCLLSDDLRQENTGKFIVIGLLGDTINVPGFPWVSHVAALLALKDLTRDEKMDVELGLRSGAVIGRGTVEMRAESSPESLAFIAFPAAQIVLSGPDELIFTVIDDEGRRVEAAHLDIRQE